ncbi:MAG: histidine kinase [Bacteroidota bacterium]
MKRFCYLLSFLLATNISNGQLQTQGGAAYRDTVPLFIKTSLFESLTHTRNVFVFLSPSIRVSVADVKDSTEMDAVMNQLKKGMKPSQLLKVEYTTVFHGHRIRWESIEPGKLLIDTSLSVSDSILLLFRVKGESKLLQQTILKRVSLIPALAMYRFITNDDSTNRKLVAKAVYENRNVPNDFLANKDSLILAPAGKILEIAIRLHSLNKDSCIEWRIRDITSDNTGNWTRTGHLLTISGFIAKHGYKLELRYPFGDKSRSCSIAINSWWWQRWWAILLFFVAVLLMATISFMININVKNKKNSRKAELAFEKSKKEQNRLDTHWLDNTFQSILGFIQNNENDLAGEYLGKASNVLRDKLIHNERMLIPFQDDLKMLKNYIASEQMKHSFQYNLTVDPLLDVDSIQMPPLLWQPCLENAIKYGTFGNEERIIVRFYSREKDLIMEISNPGKLTETTTDRRPKFGVSITEERIKGWNLANLGSLIHFTLKQADNEVIASFVFEQWME